MHNLLTNNAFKWFKVLTLPLGSPADSTMIWRFFLFFLFLSFHLNYFLYHRLLWLTHNIFVCIHQKVKGNSFIRKHQGEASKDVEKYFIDNFKIMLDEHERNLFFHRIIVDNKDGRSFCRPYTLFLLVSLQTSPKLVLYSFCTLLCPLLSFVQLFSWMMISPRHARQKAITPQFLWSNCTISDSAFCSSLNHQKYLLLLG